MSSDDNDNKTNKNPGNSSNDTNLNCNPNNNIDSKSPQNNPKQSVNTNDTRACAACKYQRRRCPPDCPLAPYFPSDHQKQFLNAHKLFGLRNMMKVYKKVKPNERDRAMKSMIFQANIRAQDPVGGCYRIIEGLQKQIQICRGELGFVLNQLSIVQNLNSSNNNKCVNNTSVRGATSGELVPPMDSMPFQLQNQTPQPEVGVVSGGDGFADFYPYVLGYNVGDSHATMTMSGHVNPLAAITSQGVINSVTVPMVLSDGSRDMEFSHEAKEIKSDLVVIRRSEKNGRDNCTPTQPDTGEPQGQALLFSRKSLV